MVQGKFDDFLYEALQPRLNVKGLVCWDIGAHIGYHSLGLAALGARVLAFEPNKANAVRFKEHLERNRELAKRMRLREEALSNCDGEVTFVQCRDISTGSSGSHLAEALPPLERDAYKGLFENVRCRAHKIDTLVGKEGEPEPDLLKIDVEGGELMVLQGGIELLRRKKPLILMEVHHICLMFEIQQLLSGLAYRMEVLDQEHSSPSRCFVVASPGS
jgi:FkbM family methyltransferase